MTELRRRMLEDLRYEATRPIQSRFTSAASPTSLSTSDSHQIGSDRNTSGQYQTVSG